MRRALERLPRVTSYRQRRRAWVPLTPSGCRTPARRRGLCRLRLCRRSAGALHPGQQATGRAPAGRDRTCRPDRREACSGMLLALELVAFQRCGRAVTLVDGLAEATDGAADVRAQAAQG